MNHLIIETSAYQRCNGTLVNLFLIVQGTFDHYSVHIFYWCEREDDGRRFLLISYHQLLFVFSVIYLLSTGWRSCSMMPEKFYCATHLLLITRVYTSAAAHSRAEKGGAGNGSNGCLWSSSRDSRWIKCAIRQVLHFLLLSLFLLVESQDWMAGNWEWLCGLIL